MPVELAHLGFVVLEAVGEDLQLKHLLTGEAQKLDRSDYELSFTESGFGFIHAKGQSILVQSKLKKAAFWDEGKVFVQSIDASNDRQYLSNDSISIKPYYIDIPGFMAENRLLHIKIYLVELFAPGASVQALCVWYYYCYYYYHYHYHY